MQKAFVQLLKATWDHIDSRVGALLICITAVIGCPPAKQQQPAISEPLQLQAIDLSDLLHPAKLDGAVELSSARNEWTSFTLAVQLPASDGYWLRVAAPKNDSASLSLGQVQAYQVLSMPVDMDQAGYVRHTGKPAARDKAPRALLPQPIDPAGVVNLAALRNPARPTDPRSRAGGPGAEPALLWFDLHVPGELPAGQYSGAIELVSATKPDSPALVLPIHLKVEDFTLPAERHLLMVGKLSWDRLEALYPTQFETFTPSWINRREARYQPTVRTLDHLVALAQEHRACLVAPALRPIVKWPADEGPRIDWRDFDSMVRPWFSGDAFTDRVGLGFWPLPEAEMLDRYDRPSQLAYWSAAAMHFDASNWLEQSAVALPAPRAGRATTRDAQQLSLSAAQLLRCNPKLRVLAPLEDGELKLGPPEDLAALQPDMTGRLLTAGAALVAHPAPPPWGPDMPRHWLRTDLPGLVPYFGAGGDERDVRVWAWLAFLRHLDPIGSKHPVEQNYILWNSTLPLASSPEQAADPGELIWFYPGSWFGLDAPVPTVQLKWLRRAQQDYECLLLAQQRGETITALQLARLLTKPVEIQKDQTPDAVYALMTGATDPDVWNRARRLINEAIQLHKPFAVVDPAKQQELYIRTLEASAAEERPLLLARGADWRPSPPADDASRQPGTWVDLTFHLDIYNASEVTGDNNRLRWSKVPAGWEIKPQEVQSGAMQTYHVLQAELKQRFNFDKASASSREPLELEFINGHTEAVSPLSVVLPAATSDLREGRLSIDGNLDDWNAADAISEGPLVCMLDRPTVHLQQWRRAATSSTIYTSWARENFYLAFSVEGLAPMGHRTQNFIDYQQRRAWGEDLFEILVQAMQRDGSLGPVLHVVLKPSGGVWIERKTAGAGDESAWKAVESSGIRYAAATPDSAWRGEAAIPWATILGHEGPPPAYLRFNVTQHKALTGESATWAGPVDYGRDDKFMGLIYLRSPAGAGGPGNP